MAIAIIDYGAGNLLSISRAITQAGGEVVVAQTAAAVESAEAVVLPGVGAAGSAMRALEESGIAAVLRRRVPEGLPLLGICLGMQLCFDWLEEGDCAGLGFIPGRVTRLVPFPGGKVPHMGWNTITWDADQVMPLLQGLASGSYAYFVHSYRCDLAPDADVVAAWTDYGERMCAVVGARPHPPTPSPSLMERGSEDSPLHRNGEGLGVRPSYTIWGTQFHPEKSGADGLVMVRNFVELAAGARPHPLTPSPFFQKMERGDQDESSQESLNDTTGAVHDKQIERSEVKLPLPIRANGEGAGEKVRRPQGGKDAPPGSDPQGAEHLSGEPQRTEHLSPSPQATGWGRSPSAPLTIYPAIDLLGGKCVRLLHGEYDKVTTYDGDPLEAARRWRDQGAEWLHIIDLDGARQGKPVHLEVVARIVAEIGMPVRLGGGLRTAEDVAAAFAAGVKRVTLGTAALDATLLQSLVARWGAGIEIALDRRGDAVAVDGWQSSASLSARDWARQAVAAGVRAFLVTDIRRDGALTGANVDLVAQTRADAGETSIAITIAGGVSTVDDIRQLARAGADGAVIGRALYDGRITLPAALAAAQEDDVC